MYQKAWRCSPIKEYPGISPQQTVIGDNHERASRRNPVLAHAYDGDWAGKTENGSVLPIKLSYKIWWKMEIKSVETVINDILPSLLFPLGSSIPSLGFTHLHVKMSNGGGICCAVCCCCEREHLLYLSFVHIGQTQISERIIYPPLNYCHITLNINHMPLHFKFTLLKIFIFVLYLERWKPQLDGRRSQALTERNRH